MSDHAHDTGETEYGLSSLPLWRGPQTAPGINTAFPFELGWDRHGYIRQTTPRSVRDDVIAEYADPAYQYMTTPPGGSAWANRLGDKYITAIRDLVGEMKGMRILEIGAGSTYIANRLLDEFGAESYVIVDPALTGEADRRDGALEIIGDYYPSTKVGERTFDLVIALNCLEHVDDPVDFLTQIRAALSNDDAKAVLVFPDVTAQFLRGDLNVLLHEHLNYFDAAGTEHVMSSAGLTARRQYSEIDTWFVLAAKDARASIEDTPENPDLLSAAVPLFEGVVEKEGALIREKLDAGGIVLFHGAVNGLNTFFYLTGLGERENIRLVDGDDTKSGRYLPACSRIISMPSKEIYAQADIVYVSAVTFFDEIRRDLLNTYNVPEEKIRPLFQVPAQQAGS